MRYLLLLFILAALFIWLSWRFRRQITAARQVWKMLVETNRRMRQQTAANQPQQQQKIPAGKLVRCEKCQTWVPKDSALNFGNNTYFCSPKCMEKAVAVSD